MSDKRHCKTTCRLWQLEWTSDGPARWHNFSISKSSLLSCFSYSRLSSARRPNSTKSVAIVKRNAPLTISSVATASTASSSVSSIPVSSQCSECAMAGLYEASARSSTASSMPARHSLTSAASARWRFTTIAALASEPWSPLMPCSAHSAPKGKSLASQTLFAPASAKSSASRAPSSSASGTAEETCKTIVSTARRGSTQSVRSAARRSWQMTACANSALISKNGYARQRCARNLQSVNVAVASPGCASRSSAASTPHRALKSAVSIARKR